MIRKIKKKNTRFSSDTASAFPCFLPDESRWAWKWAWYKRQPLTKSKGRRRYWRCTGGGGPSFNLVLSVKSVWMPKSGSQKFPTTYSRMTLVSGHFLSPGAGEGDTEAKIWALDVLKPHPWHHYFVTRSIATCSPGETLGLRLGHIFEPFHWTPKSCEPRRHGRDPQTFWALHGRFLPS